MASAGSLISGRGLDIRCGAGYAVGKKVLDWKCDVCDIVDGEVGDAQRDKFEEDWHKYCCFSVRQTKLSGRRNKQND